jgi:glutamate-1-semialdehyde aminotransferase
MLFSPAMIDRARVERRLAEEEKRFVTAHPRSRQLFERGCGSLLAGVPMPWMVRWPGGFPVFVGEGRGAPLLDRYMHLAALNRGILLTPFHNMALIAPDVTEADIDRHTLVFRESVQALLG